MRRILLAIIACGIIATPALADGGHGTMTTRVGEVVTLPAPPPPAKGQTIRASYSKKHLRKLTTSREAGLWRFRFRALAPGVSKVTFTLVDAKGTVRGRIATEVRITRR